MTARAVAALKALLRWALRVQSPCASMAGHEWTQVGLWRAMAYRLEGRDPARTMSESFAEGLRKGLRS
jgi:hypothetical protein